MKIVITVLLCILVCSNQNIVHAFEDVNTLGMMLAQTYNSDTQHVDKRGSLVVLDIKRGSLAQRVGIQKGDIILKVNNVVTKAHDLKYIVDNYLNMQSSANRTIILWRPEDNEKFEFILQ